MPQKRRANRSEPVVAGELQTFKAQFFRALAHPTRIRMLEILVRGGRTVQELQEALALDQPIVSQQLAVLRNQGIVSAQKKDCRYDTPCATRSSARCSMSPGGFLTIGWGTRGDCCVSCGESALRIAGRVEFASAPNAERDRP